MSDPIRISLDDNASSGRLQRRVEELLDRAERSADLFDWRAARAHAREALLIDAANHDASVLLSTAEAMLADAGSLAAPQPLRPVAIPTDEWGSAAREWFERNTFVALLALETLLVLVLGFLFLGDKSFWLDEATTARLIDLDWSGLRKAIESTETNQAVYYLLLKIWAGIGGDGELWLRSFSVLCAAAAVPAVAVLGRSLFSERVGLFAGLLLALNPVVLFYAQEARGYAMVMLLVTLATYAFVRLVKRPTTAVAVAFVVLSALAAYVHFFAILVTGAQLASLVMLRNSPVRWTLVAQCVGVLGVLLLPIVYVSATPNTGLNWVGEPNLDVLVDHLKLQTGGTLQLLAYSAIGVIGLVTLARLLRPPSSQTVVWPVAMVLCWLVLPTAVAFFGSFIKPVFVSRYLIVCLPALALFIAYALSQVPSKTAAYALTGVLVLLALPAFDRVYFETPKEDWRDATSFILSEAQPGDAIVFHSPWVEGPYNYYAVQSSGKVRPAVAFYDAGAHEAIGSRLKGEGYDRVWLVLAHTGFSSIPEIAEARLNLEQSLDSTFDLETRQDFFGPIQVQLYD